jgi:hypothetical protein
MAAMVYFDKRMVQEIQWASHVAKVEMKATHTESLMDSHW